MPTSPRRFGRHISPLVLLLTLVPLIASSAGAIAVIRPRSTASPAVSRGAVPPRSRTLARAAQVNVFEGLNLTDAQHAQMRIITERSRAARLAILTRQVGRQPLSTADRDELRRIGEAHNAAVRALLTPAQQTRLDANLGVLRAEYAAAFKAQVEAKRAAATARRTP
jgi:Spy/CpxP family protein refolding chaperone